MKDTPSTRAGLPDRLQRTSTSNHSEDFMPPFSAHPKDDAPASFVTPRIALVRLALGLGQGLALYFLYHATQSQTWPATEPLLFAPLLLVFAYIPLLVISGLGHLSRLTLWRWVLLATLVLAGLGYYDIWRSMGAPAGGYNNATPTPYPSQLLWLFGAAGLYIAHTLVLAAASDQRRIASYPSYFDSAWKLLIQLQFSSFFVGVFWLVLWLGAALFKLIALNFLQDLLRESWFAIPVTVFAFACAIHLTDMRPAIVRGIRNLLLVLLSWILPITVLIIAGFLLSLPFTGLEHLWATRHATALLLSAAATLVVLINTAFQNGAVADEVAPVLRISARLASGLLLPLVAIAVYALGLRVGDYGWTTDRIIAACCLLVASCYALGYAWAAARSTVWLAAVAPVNIATAFVILALLLALFSPLLDPARISVANQVGRLERGQQTADKFDFDYLRFQGKRYGAAALERLQASTQGKDAALVRERATRTLEKKNRWDKAEAVPSAKDLFATLKVWPSGQTIPDSFLAQDWAKFADQWRIPACLKKKTVACDVYPIDFDGDNKAELLLIDQENPARQATLFAQEPDASWSVAATLPGDFAKCALFREKLQQGDYTLVAPRMKELEIAGTRIRLNAGSTPKTNCPATTP